MLVILKMVVVNGSRITESLGLALLLSAVAYVMGPGIVGHIFDMVGSYR